MRSSYTLIIEITKNGRTTEKSPSENHRLVTTGQVPSRGNRANVLGDNL